MAFVLAFTQVGIASKYFGPIILSINHMMKDVLLFLMTFAVIMLAFACGVSYIFNMAVGEFTTLKIRNVYKTTFENARHFLKKTRTIHFIVISFF